MSESSTNKGASAGKGLAFIAFAKVFFIVSGFGVQLLLPRLLGSREAFGRYAAVINVVNMLTNVLIAATIQNVSRRVNEDESRSKQVLREALLNQLLIGSVLSLSLFGLAPFVAGQVLLQPELESFFRIASVVVFAYALYAALVGYLNGSRRFLAQAGLDITFSTLRSIGLLVLPFLGYGIAGALVGFSSAAVTVLLIAFALAGFGTRSVSSDRMGWWKSLATLAAYQGCLNLILQIDLSVLGRTVVEMGLAQGMSAVAATDLASKFNGLYRAAQTFAFVPYQFILSVTFIVFPLIAKATSSGDHETARTYVARAMRLSLIVLMALAAPVAGAADGVLRIAYEPEYLVAADALRVLVLGIVPFSLFVIAATVLSGSGRASWSAFIAAGSLIVLVVAVRTFIMIAGPTDKALIATALGTSLGATVALITVGTVIYKRYQAFLPLTTILRVGVCALVGAGVAQLIPHATRFTAFAALVGGAVAYAIALVVTRELGIAEIKSLLAPILKKRSAAA